MVVFFTILLFLSIIGLVIGLIAPKVVVRWGPEEKRTRKKSAQAYGLVLVVALIGIGVTAPKRPMPVAQAPTPPAIATSAPKPTAAPKTTTKQPWEQLTADQQKYVKVLFDDTTIVAIDAENKDLGQFASDLEAEDQDVDAAEDFMKGPPLSSNDSVDNVYTWNSSQGNLTLFSGEVSLNQGYRTLLYSVKTFDSAYINPSNSSFVGDLATANNANNDIASSFMELGYNSGV